MRARLNQSSGRYGARSSTSDGSNLSWGATDTPYTHLAGDTPTPAQEVYDVESILFISAVVFVTRSSKLTVRVRIGPVEIARLRAGMHLAVVYLAHVVVVVVVVGGVVGGEFDRPLPGARSDQAIAEVFLHGQAVAK